MYYVIEIDNTIKTLITWPSLTYPIVAWPLFVRRRGEAATRYILIVIREYR